MFRKTAIFLSAVLLTGLVACKDNYVDPDVKAAEQNQQEIQQYLTSKNLTAQRTESGLHYIITTPNPNGKKPALGEEVEFSYTLYTLADVKVDSTKKDSSVIFPIGLGAMLPGLEQGLALMREGEKATLLMPAYLAYGSRVQEKIPANSAVRFDVQLLHSRTEEQQIEDYITAQKLKVTEKTGSGLRLVKTKDNPAGASLTNGQTVRVNYNGRLLRKNQEFDKGSFELTLGQRQVVTGFEEGISKLKVGEKATIIFPSTLGYGSQGSLRNGVYVIPPYAPLAFDIEIVSVR